MAGSARPTTRIEVETPAGPAWVDLDLVGNAAAVLMIGHGAGGSVDAPDLLAVRDATVAVGISVARVTQPYRVAGRRSPAPAPRLDEAWLAVHAALRRRRGWRVLPFVHAGRSSGARVACRCADAAGAAAVVALAFPVHPPGQPGKSRVDELAAVGVPLLVVQGRRDAFGQPPAELFDGVTRQLAQVPGDHSLKAARGDVGVAVAGFLTGLGLGQSR
jgi:predicted alpha/beta-hydrolase family hydrolase